MEEERNEERNKAYYGLKLRKTPGYFELPIRKADIKKLFHPKDQLMVQTNRGEELGEIAIYPACCKATRPESEIEIKRILRNATVEDIANNKQLNTLEKEIMTEANNFMRERKIPAKVFSVELIHDRKRVLVYYKNLEENENKKSRLSLSPLMEFLNKSYSFYVEFREKGGRGEAKQIGGTGICGRQLCCTAHLQKYRSVTVKTLKKQGLAINTYKMSGPCTKLLCCMNYDADLYNDRE